MADDDQTGATDDAVDKAAANGSPVESAAAAARPPSPPSPPPPPKSTILSSVSRGLAQVSQYARGGRGSPAAAAAASIELPDRYYELETRVDTLQRVYTALLRVSRVYARPGHDYTVAPAAARASGRPAVAAVAGRLQALTRAYRAAAGAGNDDGDDNSGGGAGAVEP
ncbi:hypothetical protein HK405_013782, partial [Cladochytrium tenue]